MVALRLVGALCCVLVVCSPALSANSTSYRLPLEVIPSKYTLQLVPYFNEGNASRQFTFDGKVEIVAEAQSSKKTITLHAKNLKVYSIAVTESDSETAVSVKGTKTDSERDFLILQLGKSLTKGKNYRITIGYTGTLNENAEGFYRQSYDIDGKSRWMAVTEFKETSARLAFPCFDEPALKATFDIKVARPKEMSTLSNMPLRGFTGPDSSLNGRYWDIFYTTKKMSTYLVAVAVSEYQSLKNGIISVWAKPSSLQQAQYALTVSGQLVKVLENILGMSFPLSKMDEIGVPTVVGDTLENWGLITLSENYMFLSANTQENQYKITSNLAFSISHQWLGDMVTFNWWKYAWLTEAFNNFFFYHASAQVYPEWNLETRQVRVYQGLLESDSASSLSWPLTRDAETPKEIKNMFEPITWYKGGAVVRMLAHALSFNTFFKGVRNFINTRAYSDAVPDDLAAGLQTAVKEDGISLGSGVTMKGVIDTWSVQAGYPVVTVTRDYTAGTATLKQEHFRTDKNDPPPSYNAWYIPISYTTSEELEFNNTKANLWMVPGKEATIKKLPSKDKWIILNKQASGYFRVNYDQNNWNLLEAQLNGADSGKINELNRMQLMRDGMYFYHSGLLDVKNAMGIVNSLQRETNPELWLNALPVLQNLYEKFSGSPDLPVLQKFYLRLMKNMIERVSVTRSSDDSLAMNELRPELLHWMCLLGHENCVQSAKTLRSSGNNARIEGKVKRGVYCGLVREHGEASWNWLWNVYQSTEDLKERQHALQALGCASDTTILKRLLSTAINESSGLKPQDRLKVFSAICNGRDSSACDLTLEFLASNINRLAATFGEYESIAMILNRIGNNLKTEDQLNHLNLILLKNKEHFLDYEALTRSAVKTVQENVKWLKSKGAEIVNWLSKQ